MRFIYENCILTIKFRGDFINMNDDIISSYVNRTNLFMVLAIVLAVLFLVCLVIGIVLLIKNKKTKTSIKIPVLMIIGSVLLVVGAFSSFVAALYNLALVSTEYSMSIANEKSTYAKREKNGNIYYSVDQFSLIDNKGNVFDNKTLTDYKYTIINFWEPWCGHCKNEMPDLNKIYEKYKDKGINVIGIYKDEKNADEVISEYKVSYPVVHVDQEQFDKLFQVFSCGSIPETIILDSNGILINLQNPESSYSDLIGNNKSEETIALYQSLIIGEKPYQYFEGVINKLLKN